MARRGRGHYGWTVVAALCVTEVVSWGIVYYGFPVFLHPMEVEFGRSRVAVTGAFSLGLAVSALAAPLVGRALDRWGPRGLMTLGSCLGTALVLAWSRAPGLVALYAIWVLMGLVMATTLYEPAFAAVVQWFAEGRDRALLVVTLAGALASTIFMPLASRLIARLGWRPALLVLGGILAGTIPIHALVLRRPPRHPAAPLGLRSAAAATEGVTLSSALHMPMFWVLAATFVVANFATVTVTVHVIPYLVGLGYAATAAAEVIGWMGAMQVPGRLVFVPVAAWLGPRAVTASVFLAQAAGVALLALAGRLPNLVPVIVLLGAANGMSTLARATAVADIFGRRSYASISGAIAFGANGARALAPVGASLLLAGLGAYDRVFWALAAGLVLAGVAMAITETRLAEE